MAQFVVHLGMSPAEFKALTVRECNAIIEEAERKNG